MKPGEVISDVVCPACGCMCDDLRVRFGAKGGTKIDGGCAAARQWWSRAMQATDRPGAECDGRPAELGQAIAAAVRILSQARSPLIFGFSGCGTETVRAAVALADYRGATIDLAPTPGRTAATLAFQQVGQSSCTLGEVRQRADLVVLWNVDPERSHPRLLEKCGVTPGDGSKRVIAVRDLPRGDLEGITQLRLLLRGIKSDARDDAGPDAQLAELAAAMKNCRYGVLLFGDELGCGAEGRAAVEALQRMVIELNDVTRFAGLRLEGDPGAATASQVLCWQTGYPSAVNFARGYPRYLPGEANAEAMLRRGETDACVIIGDGVAERLSPEALAGLRKIPHIVIAPAATDWPWTPAVRLTTGVDGVHHTGTVVRMDEVPLPLRAIVKSNYPSAAEVCSQILRALQAQASTGL